MKRILLIIMCILLMGCQSHKQDDSNISVKETSQADASVVKTLAEELGVPMFRQDDARWAKDHLGKAKSTMKSSGCLVTSIACALKMGGMDIDPGKLNALLSKHHVYDNSGNLQWNQLIKIKGYHASVYSGTATSILDQNLKKGRYPIIRIHRPITKRNHFVLVVHQDDQGDYDIMDPLEDKMMKLSDYNNRIYAIRCVYHD